MRKSLFVLGAAFALSLSLAGCGGSDGSAGPTGATGAPGAPGAAGPAGPPGPSGSAAVVLTPTTPPAEFAALDLTATVTGVTIASPPVVNFKLATKQGVPVIGFGSTSKSSTAKFASYPNLAFALAKLVPGSGGTPSKWVSYIVTTVETTTTASAPTRPSTDNTGTLVDNKDGSYTYTFYRDITAVKSLVDASTDTATNKKADLGDLTYDANATHRLTIVFSGAAPGTGTNTPNAVQSTPAVNLQRPLDVIYDFVPATGAAPAAAANRKMVANSNCESCHSTLGGLPGQDEASLVFHGGSRNNIEYCMVCHTDQRRFGRTEATYNATTRAFTGSTYVVDGRTVGAAMNFVHKTHVGGVMTRTGYNYGGVLFEQAGYPQDIRNCDKCHDSSNTATPQASLWKTNSNRQACGSCHDGINFDTGVGLTLADKAAGLTVSTGFFGAAHPANSTDGTCLNSACHNAGAGGDPDLVHKPVTPPGFNSLEDAAGSNNANAAWIASNQNRLPTGAIKITHDIKSVTAFLDTSVTPNVKRPRMVFRLLQNGARKDLNPVATAALNPVTGLKEIWDNFMGAPSLYFVWAVPQDGIAQPVDFNATVSSYLRCLWNGSAPVPDPENCVSAGTLTGPDADGYYTGTLTGAIIPDSAVMLTGGIGYSYNVRSTLPLTQTNLAAYPATKSTLTGLTAGMPNAYGGLIVVAPNVQVVASAGCVDASPTPTGVCQNANNQAAASGKFVGRRAIVEDKRCNACHQELGTFTEEAFHGGQRNDGTTCSWCHTPNRASSGWTAEADNMTHAIHAGAKRTVPYTWHSVSATDNFSKIVYPGVLARCEQCHLPGTFDFTASASANAVGLGSDQLDKRQYREVASGSTLSATDISISPYVKPLLPFDFGVRFSFNATTGVTTPGAGTNLVMSPTVTACVACHDSDLARSHMVVNGGSFYEARSTATPKVEQCFICHASGRTAGITEVHAR